MADHGKSVSGVLTAHSWRVALISSGEISIAEKLSEAGTQAMDGNQMRLIDVEADSHAYGVFDDLHGAASGAMFADSLQQAVNAHHGSIGPAFVENLTTVDSKENWDVIRNAVRKRASNWSAMLPTPADGQAARVAKRFAAIGIAGELATRWGFTGWDVDEPSNAAQQAFLDWYDWRYSAQQDAVSAVMKPLQVFLDANLSSLPDVNGPHADGDEPLGWRDATRVYLQKSTWTSIYPGDRGRKAAIALRDMKMLVPEGNHLLRKSPRVIPGRPRLYTVNTNQVIAYKAG